MRQPRTELALARRYFMQPKWRHKWTPVLRLADNRVVQVIVLMVIIKLVMLGNLI